LRSIPAYTEPVDTAVNVLLTSSEYAELPPRTVIAP
jgi:hypothetical protein